MEFTFEKTPLGTARTLSKCNANDWGNDLRSEPAGRNNRLCNDR